MQSPGGTEVIVSKILVVDDDKLIGSILKRMLEARHHEVIVESGGKEGLKAAAESNPDIIILDVRMPDMDGLEVLKELKDKKETCEISALILTGADTQEVERQASYLYADGYFTKPIDIDKLSAAIDRIMAYRTPKRPKRASAPKF
jgi:DNA-binding response OmpR family regulator